MNPVFLEPVLELCRWNPAIGNHPDGRRPRLSVGSRTVPLLRTIDVNDSDDLRQRPSLRPPVLTEHGIDCLRRQVVHRSAQRMSRSVEKIFGLTRQ